VKLMSLAVAGASAVVTAEATSSVRAALRRAALS
jgi:hypothetical protein